MMALTAGAEPDRVTAEVTSAPAALAAHNFNCARINPATANMNAVIAISFSVLLKTKSM